jgi:hypothetical protein
LTTTTREPPDGRFPGTAVVVLSQYVMERAAVALVGTDASGIGYLLKDRVADLDTFIDALNRLANGGSALDPDVVSRMVGRRDTDDLDRLTPRERDVLHLMAEGRSNRGTPRSWSSPRTRSRNTSATCCASSTSPALPPTTAASWRCWHSCNASISRRHRAHARAACRLAPTWVPGDPTHRSGPTHYQRTGASMLASNGYLQAGSTSMPPPTTPAC